MKKLNRTMTLIAATAFLSVFGSSCNHLTDEAKEIVGDYYINEISDRTPLMELNDNGKAIYRTIKPEVITISAEAEWNVVGDSLTFEIDQEKINVDGDPTLVGKIPDRISKKIVAHDDWSLTLEQNGVNYVYRRHHKSK